MVARGTRNSGHMYIKFNLISAPTVYSIEIKKISVKCSEFNDLVLFVTDNFERIASFKALNFRLWYQGK